ncbi:calcium/sodium antiporter [Polymorphum gilvum]|uniref:K+-dependent Na+/Ca+ exchanger-like protein n=1 Tax=Polymorphum gilvum (strain LMG 25793 / CGMCC 1.9160 / SL003B-26A1) TaxID=991905 RepID=F2J375_POLGS|nr:calcium/sodium antiporter [Polymorphum gilvum]ADZ69882.1 K+-dependent Na+/Ca+ exchanger-like protein [Polymorphum gilvum SL003B-26A1]
MLAETAFLVLGLVLLFAGGEGLVRGAVSLAARLGMPPLIIGLTVVGFGTSMPELVVSVKAAFQSSPDIAVGNVVGSNTANILLILGAAALISPIPTAIPGIRRDLAVMLAAALVMLALGLLGHVGRGTGLVMAATLALYVGYAAWSARTDHTGEDAAHAAVLPLWKELAALLAGLVALVAGADFLVGSASAIARSLGISEAVIGLTVVAVGTSLPELATSVVAAFRRHSEIAIGNVVGSNVFNVLGILGVAAALHPLHIAPQMARFDIPLMLAVSLGLVGLLLALGRLSRPVGAGFLASYGAYCAWLFATTPGI